LPHEPYVGNDGSWIYDAEDKTTGVQYRIIRTDINNYGFVEEDSFDLSLMEQSFGSSEFISRPLSRKFLNHKGYPALDCKFKDKDSSLFLTRFIIKGPHYYTLVAHGKNETPKMQSFLNSFELTPYSYGTAKERVDTSLYFKVKTPVYPDDKKIKLDNMGYGGYFRNFRDGDEEEESEKGRLESGAYRNKLIQNETNGKK